MKLCYGANPRSHQSGLTPASISEPAMPPQPRAGTQGGGAMGGQTGRVKCNLTAVSTGSVWRTALRRRSSGPIK